MIRPPTNGMITAFTYIGIMDDALSRVFKKRVPNDLDQIVRASNTISCVSLG